MLVAAPLMADDATNARVQQEGQRILAIVSSAGHFRLLDANTNSFQLGLIDDTGQVVGGLHLDRGTGEKALRFRSRSFVMTISNFAPTPGIMETLVRAAHALADADDGSFLDQRQGGPPMIHRWFEPQPGLVDATWAVVALAILLALWRRGAMKWEVRLPHLLPAAIQILTFSYWAIYWPGVSDHFPSLVLEVILAFAADAAFSFARFGSWRIGASPLPIVLSSNLFAWFDTTGVVLSMVFAFGSKTLLRRNGRHFMNPSAVGLTVAGLIAAMYPQMMHFGGVFHTMNVAPNMTEIVALLALIAQWRFRIVPVSIGAMLMLQAQHIPGILRPSMLLAVALLATDPATIPKTDVGKLLFGGFLGVAMPFTSMMLRTHGSVDDFSKVIPIPVANLAIPLFDFVGARAESAWRTGLDVARRRVRIPSFLLKPIPNAALIGFWLYLIVPGMWQEKPGLFEPTIHWNWGTPLVTRDSDDIPRCESNPVFCKPFSFPTEAAMWFRRATRSRTPGVEEPLAQRSAPRPN